MPQIFISYSRKDIDFVRKLAGDLEAAGYDVWWDITDLQGGDDWVSKIPDAIAASQFVLVVLTPTAIASDWVRKEYTQALSLRKKVIPLMLIPSAVPFALNTINFVNFAVGEYPANYKKLLEALGHTGNAPAVQPYQKPIPQTLRKYAAPGLIGLALLLALLWALRPSPPIPPPTETNAPLPSSTATQTPEPLTPVEPASSTPSATASATVTVTPSPTATRSPTATSTRPPFEVRVRLCVDPVYASDVINIRRGPSLTYPRLGAPIEIRNDQGQTFEVCLWFHAKSEDELWLLVANEQPDAALRQYEGGWMRRDLLGFTQPGPLDLDVPAVTLTPTPTPSNTPTVTPTFTPTFTPTPSDTPTFTPSPTETETETPIPSDTPTP
jgi:hypothetical protein